MKKSKPAVATLPAPPVRSSALPHVTGIRHAGSDPGVSAVPSTIHTPVDGGRVISDRAYVLINVLPGRTSDVVRALSGIKQLTTIDPCWGKPDIIVVAEVSDQDALTQLVLSRIHEIDGVSQTDTHLVYRLKADNGKRSV
ncbi:MAG TPA: Lrp/AsnC ligand binding domain-containing protein [Nitrospiraceae bacterium]|nr:Lrp/AsnC ligand binding domain-containing protein [Nitrospiraceae bacterium]